MANYLLAGLVVDIRNRYSYLEKQCAAFRCDDALTPDITVAVSQRELDNEMQELDNRFSPGYVESISIYRKLCLQMPAFGGIFLHSSVIRVGDQGIAFLAPSGTGKSTHTALWQQLPDQQVEVINGDKPIVRFLSGRPEAFGTPWAGKENLYQKDSVMLTDLCFLEQAENNTCVPLSREEALQRIVHQVILPTKTEAVVETLNLLDQLLQSCRLWKIRCNMELLAAETAFNAIIKKDL